MSVSYTKLWQEKKGAAMEATGGRDELGDGCPAVAEQSGDARLLADVGARLREARRARGLSQAEVARRTGTARTYLVALEQGQHEPSLELLGRLAAALGYSLREFLWALDGRDYSDPAAPLARRVRLRRECLGLRATDLADRAHTTRATVSQIESGVNANPGLFLLTRLADALCCCPSELAPPMSAPGTSSGQEPASAQDQRTTTPREGDGRS